tara:strand:- start:298 stop:978 length:681 start_codon:yes stop_codon:yes gene_type:complete
MSKFTLLILSAGYGKRMLDLTKKNPKPLLEFKNIKLLDNTINFFKEIGCNEIFINSHYLYEKIEKHVIRNYQNNLVNLIYEPKILGTGGGVKNIFNYTNKNRLVVVNSDIFWQDENKQCILNFLKNLENINYCKILLTEEKNFYGLKKVKGDFSLQKNYISHWTEQDEVIFYSGLQILSKTIFENSKKIFPMHDIWNNLIIDKNLEGSLVKSKILHIGDKSSYDEL